jgi:hypothetical protein
MVRELLNANASLFQGYTPVACEHLAMMEARSLDFVPRQAKAAKFQLDGLSSHGS